MVNCENSVDTITQNMFSITCTAQTYLLPEACLLGSVAMYFSKNQNTCKLKAYHDCKEYAIMKKWICAS